MSIMRSNDPKACQGVSLRGYRRGENCGAVAKYDARGKRYCSSHYVVALKEPARFRQAMEAWVRGEVRREATRRATIAQIDAFPIEVTR